MHNEFTPVPKDVDPETFIRELLDEFNAEEIRRAEQVEKYIAYPRKFIGLTNQKGKEQSFCEFVKFNGATVLRDGQSYDIMYCKNCRLYRKRVGLGEMFNMNYQPCYPNRVCTDCNRVFITETGLIKHNALMKHKQPSWLPDGV